ncbi:MAG: universal stress protein [Chloroflexota bacterium]
MKQTLSSAVEDFHSARLQAQLESLVARLTGRSTELLSYEQVRRQLRARERSAERLEDVPLDAIVGSVGRYKDFTRSFLPKHEGSKDRWARVELAMTGMEGVPPIELYKVGDAYFVRDGHHRVSVARQLGSDHIQAYVTQVETKVPLSPDAEPDDLILKAEYAEFLEHTTVDQIRPKADLTVTEPGKYPLLEEHIEVHRHFMGLEQEQYVPYEEAVAHWYDEVYLPVVQLIRQRGILRYFPERTEADLYLWMSEHRAALEEELGWEISAEMAASDLTARFSRKPGQIVKRLGKRVLDAVTPDELEPGPPAGRWREERVASRRDDRLFPSILVAIRGDESGWAALEQALTLARRERARLKAVHILPSEEHETHPETRAVQEQFEHRCRDAGVQGTLVLDVGPVHRRICDRARWADLIVVSLNYPPLPQPVSKLSSGLVTLLKRCPRPVLTVPHDPSHFHHALLAYDGAPKAQEALFVATYISGRWDVPLTVVTVHEDEQVGPQTLEEARQYLQIHGVQAQYVAVTEEESSTVAESILTTAQEEGCDLILMGGYGMSPVAEAVLGSAVDRVLRESQWPTLICR